MGETLDIKPPPRFIDAYAGAGAGLLGTLIGYPLDVIKGRMQAASGESSMTSIVRTVYSGDGVKGFYKGVVPPIVSLTMLNMLNFSNYAFMTKTLNIDHSAKGFNPLVFVAGAAVGPAASFISTPFEFLKIQLQFSQKNSMPYKNTIDAAMQIYRSHGIKALYTGHSINTYREVLFLGTYFTCYEHIKQGLGSSLGLSLAVPLSGGLAGAVGWLVSFPLDAIKTNIQNIRLGSSGTKSPALSIKDAALHQFREKGFLNMYKGVGPSILRAFIVSSSRFSVYETILWALSS
jgi:solute carrier family 25 carnitine/acylcarnitine transporter 20/29